MGDPAGIGPEIIGKAWLERHNHKLQPFFAIGDINAFAVHWGGPVTSISNPAECDAAFDEALPVLHIFDCAEITAGKPHESGTQGAYNAIEMAVKLTHDGDASAVVTAPVSKAQLYNIGFAHPGQTEFVADLCGVAPKNATMMLAAPELRVVPMTTHIPLVEVANALTADLIAARLRATDEGLRRNFGIEKPRLALAGLNPHAGESGNLGQEEIELFEPIVEMLRAEGMDISGPLPADTMFHAAARKTYDAAICAYHDQALIPIKALYFDQAVNMTLGLPIIRTSPDHGTAFNIAGKDVADASSMIAAIKMASACAQHRAAYDATHG